MKKYLIPILFALAAIANVTAGVLGYRHLTRNQARAAAALVQLDSAKSSVRLARAERDSALQTIADLQARRNADASTTKALLAKIANVPHEKPDTCLKWIARSLAQDTVTEKLQSQLADADSQIAIAKRTIKHDTVLVNVLVAAVDSARPIVQEVATPKLNLGTKLLSFIEPKIALQYGATTTIQNQKVDVRVGPALFVGVRIEVPLSRLVP